MSTDITASSKHRLATYGLFAGCVIFALVLQNTFHEMHLSKLLFFAGIGVWARELPPGQRWPLLVMVTGMCLLLLITWHQFRNQVLVPIEKGSYRIENK